MNFQLPPIGLTFPYKFFVPIIMKTARHFSVTILAFLLSACSANSTGSQNSGIPTVAPKADSHSDGQSSANLPMQRSTDKPAESISSINGISKGMAYADFRKALLAQGWQPVVDKKCRANVAGGAYKQLCAKGSDSCKACDDLPELSVCSGDAVCVMNFKHASETLQASTYGDIGDRNVSGKDSQLNVTGWAISSVPTK